MTSSEILATLANVGALIQDSHIVYTSVAFHLQWRFTDVAHRIVTNLQTVQSQFATDDDCGPAYANPAAIKRKSFVRLIDDFVIRRIKQRDDFPSVDDCVRNPDFLSETASQAACDRRFSVSRRAVQKEAAGGVDRRPDHVEQFF